MADLAQAALRCVFEQHAGFLKSYEADGFKRLMAAARISERMRTEVSLAWKKYNPSDGDAGIFEFVRGCDVSTDGLYYIRSRW